MMNQILMTRIKGFDGIQEEQCYLEYGFEQDTYIYLANINSIKDTFIERGAAVTSVLTTVYRRSTTNGNELDYQTLGNLKKNTRAL